MSEYDRNALADVYIATMAGTMGKPRILWRMTIADAMKMCSHESTCGTGRGGEWALHWTHYDLPGVEKRFEVDDGRFDGLMKDMGVKVVAAFDIMRYHPGIRADGPLAVPASKQPVSIDRPGQLSLFEEVA